MKKNKMMRFKLASHDMKTCSKMACGQAVSQRQSTDAQPKKTNKNAIISVIYETRRARCTRRFRKLKGCGKRTPQAGVETRLALPLMPLPAQHFSLFVLAHLLAALFYNTTHVNSSVRAPDGAAAM